MWRNVRKVKDFDFMIYELKAWHSSKYLLKANADIYAYHIAIVEVKDIETF